MDINRTNVFLGQVSQDNRIKNKNKQMSPNQTYKPLLSKGNHQKQKTNKQTKNPEDNLWNGRKYLQVMQLTKA